MPHDILDLENLSKLPASFRSIALAASNGSLEDLSKCYIALTYPDLRSSPTATWLLPVFYLHLDPTKIPTPDAVDVIVATATHHPCIDAACIALKAVGEFVDTPIFPHFVAPDLWRRVWPWIHFIHTYWHHLPGPSFNPKAEIDACLEHSFLVAKLRIDASTREMTSAQSGVRFIFARAWTAILLDGVVEESNISRQSCRLLAALTDGLESPGNFEEVLDGAGGGLDRLASAILKQVSLALAERENSMAVTLTLGMTFLGARPEKSKEWVAALLSRGVIALAISALDAFDNSAMSDAVESAMRILGEETEDPTEVYLHSTKACFNTLLGFLTTPPGYPWIAEAVKDGLLHMLISVAIQGSRHDGYIKSLISQVLSPHLVSRSVISQMKKAVKDVETFARSPKFTNSPMFALWEDLVDLVEERVVILEEWESAGGPSFLACDNILCGKIQRKNEFKRCAGCCSANYCSSHCQSIDWREGHREVCDDLRAVRYNQLLNIGIGEAQIMRDHPGEEYIIVFDYAKSGGPLKINIDPKRTLQASGHLEVELPVQWRRLQRSGGRMGMHVMYVQEGTEGRPRLFPLRASGAEFHQGLLAIAQSNPFEPRSDEEQQHDERAVKALIDRTSGHLTFIH